MGVLHIKNPERIGTVYLAPGGVRARQHRAFEPAMSEDPSEYVCEFCGETLK